ncbi:hypothetical protein H310_05989 [Aphanomyces invadans]|uniref:Uncharacterized protein n=1 Tax=Aphanomyces invadans TaxID=157072 RepID=A0A024UA64_9STRA|nr:hypothetical protein H310_05989 [Aphanomyces invadans]ETW02488.1 hypothetical protein H310_05989 [Aphanomyces invadans]|eukprot:XP_008869093.1 hypothetical protein H310_05989 [Aphanomyces invadans]
MTKVRMAMDERAMIDQLSDMVAYSISEDDIQIVLAECDGDIMKALDELLNLKAIQKMDVADESPRHNTELDGQLQWNLFTKELESYGLDDQACRELIQVLKERRGAGKLLSLAIVLELLDSMNVADEHPLKELQNRYPMIPLSIIEESFECNNFNLHETMKALVETKSLLNESGTLETFSYAAVAKPSAQPVAPPPPEVNCKYEFPTLTKLQRGKSKEALSVWHKSLHGLPTGGRGTLTTRMKLELLQSSFPTIDTDIVCTVVLVH